jgi:hypothetical protein
LGGNLHALGLLVVLVIAAALIAVLVVAYGGPPQPACPNVEPGVTPNPVMAAACATPTP